jgi:hypothetical protein
MFTCLQDKEICDLGVILVPRVFLDSHLQMTGHVNNVCKSVYLSLRNIGKYINHITIVKGWCLLSLKAASACFRHFIDSCNSTDLIEMDCIANFKPVDQELQFSNPVDR